MNPKPGVDLVTLMGEDVKWFFEAAAGACEEAHDATPAARLERRGGLCGAFRPAILPVEVSGGVALDVTFR